MHPITRHFIIVAVAASLISSGYYISLVLHLPFLVFNAIVIGSVCYYFFHQYRNRKPVSPEKKISLFAFVLLVCGLGRLTYTGWLGAEKYGSWDAKAMWNYHAMFLTDPLHWSQLYRTNTAEHADYPMFLSGTIAWLWRLIGHFETLVPLTICFWVMLAIASIVFVEIYRKSFWLAVAGLSLLTMHNRYFISSSVSQYADTLIAFFLLAAAVCMKHFRERNDLQYLLLCGACLGSAMWTKNEGVMYSAIFIAFNWRSFFSKKHLVAFLTGLVPVIVALFIHKVFYAPGNDMREGVNNGLASKLTAERASYILSFFNDIVWNSFNWMYYVVTIYISWSVIKFKKMSVEGAILLTILIAFFMTYMVTPHNLRWHLETSFGRLLQQIFPVTIYFIAMNLTHKKGQEKHEVVH